MAIRTYSKSKLQWLYLANAVVLITHEIDSAYWHEWNLFGLPGGIQLFLVLNLFLVTVVLFGFRALILNEPSGRMFSWLLVISGWFAVVIHGFFLMQGDMAFRLPVSLVLLLMTLILSTLQAYALVRSRRPVG